MASGPITSWQIDGEKWKWNRRGRGGHDFGKNDIPQEYNINRLESNGSKIADKSTSTRPWSSVYAHFNTSASLAGLPWWLRWERICLQCGRLKFNPWVRKIPWIREWQPTLVFLPGEFHGQRSLVDMWSQRVRHDWAMNTFSKLSDITQGTMTAPILTIKIKKWTVA